MKTQIFRYILYSIVASVTWLILAAGSSSASSENGTHFCGFSEQQPDNRRYARSLANLDVGEPRTVRMIYFLPNDRPYRADVVQRMKNEILNIQTFYSELMNAHGNMTFRVETDAQSEPMVHRIDGDHTESRYLDNTVNTVLDEIDIAFNREENIYLIVLDYGMNVIESGRSHPIAGVGVRSGKTGGFALVLSDFDFKVTAHELGHAFGLGHDFRDGAYIMSYGSYGAGQDRLSACHAEFLSVHPYFNANTPSEEGEPPTIELISPRIYALGSQSVPIRLKINDSVGLHQVLLSVNPIVEPYSEYGGIKECRKLTGDRNTIVEFDYDGVIPPFGGTSLSELVIHPITVLAVDTEGNTGSAYFTLSEIQPNHMGSIEAHMESVVSVAFSSDGVTLATGSWDGTVKLWNVVTRQNIAIVGSAGPLVAFSSDGVTLAIGSRDGTVKLWDVATQRDIGTLPHGAGVTSVAFSHDGMLLAAGSWDGTVKLWDVATQREIATLKAQTDAINSVSFSSDGSTLAAGSWDGTVKLWDVATRREIAPLQARTDDIISMAFSSVDATLLATGSWDRTVKLWDVATRQNTATFEGHTSGVNSVSFSRDGSTLASGSWDRTVRLWDVTTRTNFATYRHTSGVISVSFSSDDTTLASGTEDGTIELWDTSGLTQSRLEAVAEIDIRDPNLRAVIAEKIELSPSTPILRGQLQTLIEFDGRNANISDLTGLEGAVNLRTLDLGLNYDEGSFDEKTNRHTNTNSVSDMSPLSGLTKLVWIDLTENSISDISAVVGLTNLIGLELGNNSISDISAVAGLTNLEQLDLAENSLSDISAIAGLTNLRSLTLFLNNISDISPVAGLTNLYTLTFFNNSVSDISAVAGLTNLTKLQFWDNLVSDISAVAGLTNLKTLSLPRNSVSDISVVAGLTNLSRLMLWENSISDISPLVENAGLASGDEVDLGGNPLSYASIYTHIPALQERGVEVTFYSRTPRTIRNVSGDDQRGSPGTTLEKPFVVEVQDERSVAFEGVPVTFTVTAGDGTLRTTSTATDANGRAESTLTLGPNPGTNTVTVSVAGSQEKETFNAEGVRTPKTLEIFSGGDQEGAPGAALENPFVVEVRDQTDKPLPGVQVTFSVTSGGGTLSATSVTTNSNGRADSTLTLGPNPGTNTVTVSVAGTQQTETINAEGIRIPETLDIIAGNDQEGAPSAALENPFVVEVRDQSGDPLPGVQVAFSVSIGGGMLSATSATTDVNGRAESILTLGLNPGPNTVTVSVTGIQEEQTITAIAELPPIPQDVNGDDMVNILDLVLVASVLGDEGGDLAADVNEDGVVNILDLVMVAGALGNAAAAPSVWYRDLEEDLLSGVAIAFPIRSLDPSLSTRLIAPTRAEVGQWLAQAGELGLTDATSQRGVLFLEQLFAALTPKETALLPNYPNPFNPETWIPYQLANGMNVQISIYDISGELVRQLDLGHQRAGHYTERSRAAYWDGRNGGGERVASGVYFYTLAADTFRSTRKMLVGK